MSAPTRDSLPDVFRDIVRLLEHSQIPYLVIGGVAQAVVGEPRVTQDLDCIIAVSPVGIQRLLDELQNAGFGVDRPTVLQRIDTMGTFSVARGRWRVDMILSSTKFEQSAFQRSQRFRLYEVEANLPTPEDLILLKLVPGRDKDILDVKTLMVRHRHHLDRSYMEQWAQQLSDEAEDARILHTLHRLLREVDGMPS